MSSEVQKCSLMWEIENYSFSTKLSPQTVNSPCFKLKILDNTNWILKCDPERLRSSEVIWVTLFRDHKDAGPEKVQINARICVLTSDKTSVFEKEKKCLSFAKGSQSTFSFILTKDRRRNVSAVSSTEILTICCQIWKSSTELEECTKLSEETSKVSDEALKMALDEISKESSMGELHHLHPTKFFARTKIEIEKRSFTHQVIDFSNLPSPWIESFVPECVNDNNPQLFLILNFKKELDVGTEIRPLLKKIDKSLLVKCIVKVVPTKGSPACVMNGSYLFHPNEPLVWKTSFEKSSHFFENKNLYLNDDILTLQFELAISNGTETCSFEELFYTIPIDSARKKDTLMDYLLKFYEKQKYCDVKLQIGKETVQTHRAVLCSRSPVFREMFESEIPDNKVVVTNVDMITLKTMISFMYSENTESLKLDNVAKLYSLADKYQYEVLRKRCSLYLSSHIQLGNVCEVLILANNFGDEELKTASFDYIRSHAEDVFGLKKWKSFLQNNILLATEAIGYVSSVAKKSYIDKILM